MSSAQLTVAASHSRRSLQSAGRLIKPTTAPFSLGFRSIVGALLLGSSLLGTQTASAGEKIFQNCPAEPGNDMWMLPGCVPTTDELIDSMLQSQFEWNCPNYFHGIECQWTGPKTCGLGILIGPGNGCKRPYKYRLVENGDFIDRDEKVRTRGLNNVGVTWVDHAHLMCPDKQLFYRDLFDSNVVPGRGCFSYADLYEDVPSCPASGNPIHPLVGIKRQVESMPTMSLAGIDMALAYKNSRHLPVASAGTEGFEPKPAVGFGGDWGSTHHKRLRLQHYKNTSYVDGQLYGVVASRGLGDWVSFARQSNGTFKANFANDVQLKAVGSEYRLLDVRAGSLDVYNDTGMLTTTWLLKGGKLSYAYSTGVDPNVSPTAGLLIAVTDHFGRSVQFHYEQPDGVPEPRVYKLIGPDGQEVRAGYDGANNLTTLTWPDEKVKTFVYDRSDIPWALTGIVDEDNQRYATFGYDAQGRATSTEHAGGVEKHSASWTNPPSWTITETYDSAAGIIWRNHRWTLPEGTELIGPNDQRATLISTLVDGMPRLTSRSQPGGSGCGASASELAYDSRGNITSEIDFAGNRSCRAYESTRNFEAVRIEGLRVEEWPKDRACPNVATYQVPDPLSADRPQRKITTTWHPLWKLETRRAEPKRITTTVYNGEKDPLNNNQVLTCIVDGDPRLPDDSKIAVVCKRYEQATDDATGNLGFNAAEIDKRSWSYTYNSFGQIKTEIGPRGQQSYEYWPSTAFTGDTGHWQGDLSKVTNALGQDTLYLEYNKRGQVLKIQHPNGSIEQREYWPRGWLKSVKLTPAGSGTPEVTEYTYYATGLLKKATQPDGSWTFYTWDAAHRLINVKDSADNSVDYVLDNMGNRKSEIYKGPQEALSKTITRTFDALGRMDSSKGLQ